MMKQQYRAIRRINILDNDKIDFAVQTRYQHIDKKWSRWQMVKTYSGIDEAKMVTKKLRKNKGESYIEQVIY